MTLDRTCNCTALFPASVEISMLYSYGHLNPALMRRGEQLMPMRVAAASRLSNQLIWIALLWPWVALADERTLSIDEAIDQAMQETPQVAASAATLEAMQAVAPSAGHLPDPVLITGVDNLPVT